MEKYYNACDGSTGPRCFGIQTNDIRREFTKNLAEKKRMIDNQAVPKTLADIAKIWHDCGQKTESPTYKTVCSAIETLVCQLEMMELAKEIKKQCPNLDTVVGETKTEADVLQELQNYAERYPVDL